MKEKKDMEACSTPVHEKSTSGYFQQFFNGNNKEEAEAIADLMTFNQSEKIKSGNTLETHICNDATSQGLQTYKKFVLISDTEIINPSKSKKKSKSETEKITLSQLKELTLPCLIMKLSISKKIYEENGQLCHNKTANEIDFVYLTKDIHNNLNVDIFEVKNGCDFDTKKSKGEVQSLTATKNVFDLNDIPCRSINIVCYDAVSISDIKIKTEYEGVGILLYENMAAIIGIDGVSSRKRINIVIQGLADERVKIMKERMRAILEM